MLKVCFAAQREHAQDPAKVLAGLNNMLRGSLGGQYVTAACALSICHSELSLCRSRAPPSLLLRTHNGCVAASRERAAPRPFPQATYSNISVPFDRGDKLLLYTDGILEATGPTGEEFGLTNLEQLLLDTQNSSQLNSSRNCFEGFSHLLSKMI